MTHLTLDDCRAMDARDPLAPLREQFELPPGVVYLASPACQDTGYILRASNGQFTATRFAENPGVDYPVDLARVKAANAEQVAALWGQIKEAGAS